MKFLKMTIIIFKNYNYYNLYIIIIIKLLSWNTHDLRVGGWGEERTARVAHGGTSWHSAASV